MVWVDMLGGMSKNGFYGLLDWVDAQKPAGHTAISGMTPFQVLKDAATLKSFVFSPSVIWFLMSLTVYVCFPYDLEAAGKGWSMDWVGRRIMVNFGVAGTYYGFFFVTLYLWPLAMRKYRPGVFPSAANMAHDLWYWALGVLQWSLSESAMMRMWATGTIPYTSDQEVLSSPWHFALAVVCIAGVRTWRDHHFYCVHRFSHIRAFYKYAHAVHHRDTDPEPFSGLCMHPIEHLVYFSIALTPAVFFFFPTSPLLYHYILMDRGMAPAAGHSGWEDHWQADQYHYIHHAKFECNYGGPSTIWIDQWSGAFRETLGASEAYKGEYKEDYDEAKNGASKVWSPQGHLGLQTLDHAMYSAFTAAVFAVVTWAAVVNRESADPVRSIGPLPIGTAVAAFVAYGPVAMAMLLCLFYDRMSWRWPFHKDKIIGSFGIFVFAGWLTCLWPIYSFVVLLCTP